MPSLVVLLDGEGQLSAALRSRVGPPVVATSDNSFILTMPPSHEVGIEHLGRLVMPAILSSDPAIRRSGQPRSGKSIRASSRPATQKA